MQFDRFTSWNPPGDTKLTEWIEAESIEYFTHGDKVKIGWGLFFLGF